jgi:hypothetical protein
MSPAVLLLSLLAHDLYLMPSTFRPQPKQAFTIAFHNGDDFPFSQTTPRLERMLNPRLLATGKSVPLTNLRPDGLKMLADAKLAAPGTWIAALESKPNGIELEPVSFKKYVEHEGLTHVLAYREKHNESAMAGRERYSKYVKSIFQSGELTADYKLRTGAIIEIVPEAHPYLLHPGDSFPIQVFFRNQPAADLQIEAAWLGQNGKPERNVVGRTSKEGRLSIPIPVAGIWKLHTVLMERCQDTNAADWESFWASLTFEIQ